MQIDSDSTIVAIASAAGAAERGLVRISGQRTSEVIGAVFRQTECSTDWARTRVPRRVLGDVVLPAIGVPLPAALMYWPGRRSYTGEPMAELHTIGSPPLLDAVVEQLLKVGARSAGRGEFTMRAFLSGRINLLQAEAVLGVIDAADHEELQMALNQLGTGLTHRLNQVRADLLALLGDLEAGLDFVEEDIEFISREQLCRRLNACRTILSSLNDDSVQRLPSGYRHRVVLAGLPNAGKSTLFNCLAGDSKAIVSPIAGTTRDYLTAPMHMAGLEVDLIDTAGWEVPTNVIMSKAHERRSEQIQSGDLVLWCTAADLLAPQCALNQRLQTEIVASGVLMLHVTTRRDLSCGAAVDPELNRHLSVSSLTGDGIAELRFEIRDRLMQNRSGRAEMLSSTASRCRESLWRALACLENAMTAAADSSGDEIVAFELRDVLHQLSAIMGEVYTDDILDHIFSNFCIGK